MYKTVLATAVTVALASSEWELEFDNEVRELSLELDGPRFEVEAESSLGDELRLRGRLDSSDLIRYDVQYSSIAPTTVPASKSTDTETDETDETDTIDTDETDETDETDDDADEIETEFNLRFFSLFEYEESGATIGFQPDEDTVVSEVTSATWSDWNLQQDCASASADCVFELSSSSTYMSTTAYFTSAATTLNNRTLTANAIKFDLGLMNYPYSGNNTYLGLGAEMYVEVEWDVEEEDTGDEDDDKLVLTSGASVGGYFTYVTYVDYTLSDGTTGTTDVITTTPSSGYEFYFAFDVEQPSTIHWDPELGVEGLAVNPGTITSPSIFAAAWLMVYALF
jgi:hypothetical protein